MREPPPLDDELEAWLSPGRAVPEVPAERADAVLGRVHEAVALSSPAPSPSPGPTPNPWWMGGGGFLVGLLVGTAVTWSAMQGPEPEAAGFLQESASAVVDEPEVPSEAAEPEVVEPRERVDDDDAQEEVARAVPRPAPARPRAPMREENETEQPSEEVVMEDEDVNTLVAERRIIDAALAQVSRGNPAAALRTVARHQERYPSGQLAEPREIVRVRALAALGRMQEAREALRSMEARFPQSTAVASLRDLVAE